MVMPEEEVVISSGMTGSTLVTDLSAFTNYSFLVEVCTTAGCTNSSVTTTTTLEIGKKFSHVYYDTLYKITSSN